MPKEQVNRTEPAAAKAEALAKIALWPQDITLVLANSVPYIFSLEFGDRYHDLAQWQLQPIAKSIAIETG